MSFISPVSTSTTSSGTSSTSSSTELGKDDFLQLLVTKLQYQDPLEPMDDADFIAQLAQFSSLEQMNNIADGISTSNEWDYLQMQSLNNVMASGFIGKDVKASYDGFYFEHGTEPEIYYTMSSAAEEVKFVIKDESGNIITTLYQDNATSGVNTITWDGTDDLGNLASEGYYSVEATATTGSGTTITPELSLVGKADSVIYRGGAAYLKINGIEIPLGDITAVGDAGAFTGTSDSDGGDTE